MLQIINNKDEMIQFIKSKHNDFGCNEDWEYFFGFELKWDRETGEILETIDEYQGEFTKIPKDEEYPVVVAYNIERTYDRFGNVSLQLYDWISIK